MTTDLTSANLKSWEGHYRKDKSNLIWPDENVARMLGHFLKNKNPSEINALDLGCGSGRHLDLLKFNGIDATGVDYVRYLPEGRFHICCLAEQLPFCDQSFNLVILWGILHYLNQDHAREVVCETLRILKTGGVLFVSVRSDKDTHLAKTQTSGDLTGGASILYSESGFRELFKEFKSINYGYTIRRPPGSNADVAHHIAECFK